MKKGDEPNWSRERSRDEWFQNVRTAKSRKQVKKNGTTRTAQSIASLGLRWSDQIQLMGSLGGLRTTRERSIVGQVHVDVATTLIDSNERSDAPLEVGMIYSYRMYPADAGSTLVALSLAPRRMDSNLVVC